MWHHIESLLVVNRIPKQIEKVITVSIKIGLNISVFQAKGQEIYVYKSYYNYRAVYSFAELTTLARAIVLYSGTFFPINYFSYKLVIV